jgi:putative transposase
LIASGDGVRSDKELATVRLSAQRGKPLGEEAWVELIARRLNLESTIRLRGRKRVCFPKTPIKEA